MAEVRKVHASEDIARINAILEEDGCVVIEGLLNEEQVRRLQEETYSNFNAIPVCQGLFFGFVTKRMSGLIAKSRVSREMAINPVILGVMDYFLQSEASPEYQLNLTQAIQIFPGEKAQIIHTDERLFPFEHPGTQALINCMWAVDDFTAENGATHVVPGSHKWPKDRQPQPHEFAQGAMPAGSVLIYFGGLLHGGGANRATLPRTGLVISYCLGWLRQAENHYLAVPLGLARSFPKRLQRILGYFVHEPNLGCVEGQDPIRLLTGELVVNGEFQEFMPEDVKPILRQHHENNGGEQLFPDHKAYTQKRA
ncbi:MAG TPA: phytanoyl-CoA dioxygenase family protein [Bryobacteraceae bacterium]|nr:phytanoyl-CoA dioxygenase family protein [Bryobacteraceae bacterium]